MNKPDHRKSRWWIDIIMMLVIAACTFSILLVGGHGGGFIWQYFTDRPAHMFLSPFGQPLWAALLLPAASFLPFRAASVLRWLSLLLLIGFFIFLGMMTEHPKWTWITSGPLLIVFVIQFARTLRLHRHSPNPAT